MGGRNLGVYELALHDLKTEEKGSSHVQGYPQKMKHKDHYMEYSLLSVVQLIIYKRFLVTVVCKLVSFFVKSLNKP